MHTTTKIQYQGRFGSFRRIKKAKLEDNDAVDNLICIKKIDLSGLYHTDKFEIRRCQSGKAVSYLIRLSVKSECT